MDFYKMTSVKVQALTNTERNIFNYVIKNMHIVKRMSIRELASACYVSTATLFRFVKKLGFSGYADFIYTIQETERASRQIAIPSIVQDAGYRDSYLKNVIEAVKVITDEKVEKFNQIMSRYPKIYILADGLSQSVAAYFHRMLKIIGYDVEIPQQQFEIDSVLLRIKREDVLLVLSYTGNNQHVIHWIEEIFTIATPTIISVTRADNNVIQNMSDLNFYVFADEIQYNNQDITSRCGMIAILETLLYPRMAKESGSGIPAGGSV